VEANIVSVDAMGGDEAPGIVIDGLARFSATNPNVRFLVHGPADAVPALLAKHPVLAATATFEPSEGVVAMHDKPGQAMRRKGTSMWNTIAAVKEGRAAAAVSAGNTGALMAIANLQLRTMKGLHRPAITASWPSKKGFAVVLDVGANVDSDPEQLVDFAIMGEAFARALHGIAAPRVGLLNVGAEEVKGHDDIREAMRLLRLHGGALGMNVHGFVEGSDLSAGTTDVIVTDGFTGNIALKTAEGTARLVGGFLKEALTSGPLSMLGAMLASGGLRKLKARMDPSGVNGGVFLGLNGLVVKSHGGADAKGFAAALSVATRLAASDYSADIARSLERLAASRAAVEAANAPAPVSEVAP
jgi:glycerol-3-phosphate acyltransferase PlsX